MCRVWRVDYVQGNQQEPLDNQLPEPAQAGYWKRPIVRYAQAWGLWDI
jgi:hypothetical protein